MQTYSTMTLLNKIIPEFWHHQDISSNQHKIFNFRTKWKLIVFFTSFMALLPLIVMTFVEFNLTRKIIIDESKASIDRILSTAAASISFSINNSKALNNSSIQTDIDPNINKKNIIISILSDLNQGINNDIFVVDQDGKCLTDSFYYGKSGTSTVFNYKILNNNSGFTNTLLPEGNESITGYQKIPGSTYFLILVKDKKWVSDLWIKPRLKLIGYLCISILLILLSIMGTATYLVQRIHSADRKRIKALHHAEYSNKLASIGRLASGVAHEINNPLAIINQKAGLIQDLLEINEETNTDPRLIPLSSDIINSVRRCSSITRRLLDFARHMEPSLESVNIEEVINQVTAFLRKEAQRKNIDIEINIKTSVPDFLTDKGSLQQIFLNLFENAITAMDDGGVLSISLKFTRKKQVILIISDTGKGIAQEDIPNIFEPFYSSKSGHWGSGLGLSITYGLVKEIQGDITIKSTLGKGTQFTLIFPFKAAETKDIKND